MSETENETPQRVDVAAVVNSFTGWDELAVERMFKMSFTKMGQSTMAGRALQFVLNRRAGQDDAAAFRAAMDVPYGELNERFSDPAGIEGDDESGEA